jgi:DNA mismatch repair ATPase MutL
VLDVQLPRSAVDVNVVPDKRTVMMQCEQEVVHALEQVCVCVFERERARAVRVGERSDKSTLA